MKLNCDKVSAKLDENSENSETEWKKLVENAFWQYLLLLLLLLWSSVFAAQINPQIEYVDGTYLHVLKLCRAFFLVTDSFCVFELRKQKF